MRIDAIAAIGYGLAAVAYLAMATLFLTRWRDQSKSPVLALATFATFGWAAVHAAFAAGAGAASAPTLAAELVRCLVWLAPVVLILGNLMSAERFVVVLRRAGYFLAFVLVLAAFGAAAGTGYGALGTAQIALCLGIGAAIIVLTEQLFRHVPQESRTGLRYFCLAVAGMFILDVAYFADAGISGAYDADLFAARGYVNGLLLVPLVIAARSRFNVELDSRVPRQIVFYSFSMIAVGLFLLAVYSGNYFIRRFGGTWTDVLQIASLSALLILIGALFVSPSFRARSRVAIIKALFQYKYDYRREWLRFIATLSQSGPDRQVPTTAVRAIAQIVNSPGGAVWARPQDAEDYELAGVWQCQLPVTAPIRSNARLIEFLSERQWVVDLDEMQKHPARYDGMAADDLPDRGNDWWLIVPMMLGDDLSGFIMLLRPAVVPVLNFEDHDLLKTAGRHVATHIEQADADRRLAEASQFGAYNRLTAFLMHDLNNLLAQQSLVVENAERFRHNPDFVDDAIDTIAHSVTRMRRLMEQLSIASKQPVQKRVELGGVIREAVSRASSRRPVPQVSGCDRDTFVQADQERLTMVIEHLLRNAQEATPDDGSVSVEVTGGDEHVEIAIVDTGSGMTQEFIRTRLFRPFDSTKGSQGMGIGAYQAREYVRSLGGRFDVASSPGAGTEFRFSLPVAGR